MSKSMLIEEFHLSLYVPRGLSDAECGAIRRDLDDARFRARLGRAVRDLIRQYPSLHKLRTTVSR